MTAPTIRVTRRPLLRLLEPWRTRLLWVSLAFNLFALPLLAAPHLWHRPPTPPGFDTLVDRFARHLPAADRPAFRDAMARRRTWLDDARRGIADRRAAVADAIGREPYDPAAARVAFADMQDALRQSASRFDAELLAALEGLSPAGRVALAESMRHRRP